MSELERLREEAEAEMRRKAPRTLDGADVHAKRRRTDPTAGDAMPSGSADRKPVADGADPADEQNPREEDAELDVSLERYEYAASSILAGTGGVGFAATCAFNREKSATKELLELLRPHVRWHDEKEADAGKTRDDPDAAAVNAADGASLRDDTKKKATDESSPPPRLRLNPVKMPGRGFVFVRLSVAKRQTGDSSHQSPNSERPNSEQNSEQKSKSEDDEKSVAASLGRLVSRAARALVASVRAGAVPAPRWVEKVVAIQATCAMPDEDKAETDTPFSEGVKVLPSKGRLLLSETVARVVACLDLDDFSSLHPSSTFNPEGDDGGVRFAVAFANRFKGRGGETSAEFKRYAREAVVPAVAAAAETALAAATAAPRSVSVALRDPDVTFFVEVLSVPAGGADGSRAGGFVERLAIGAAAKRDGVFELKRGAIRPVALKRASEATG